MTTSVLTLAQIAARIGADIVGVNQADAVTITGLGSLSAAQPGQISHLSSSTYKSELAATDAAAVILRADDAPDCPTAALVVDNPYLAFAQVSQLFSVPRELNAGIHETAVVGADCDIDATASIGPYAIIGARCRIGPGAKVFGHSTVAEDCVIDADVVLMPHVSIYPKVSIGARTVLHSGVVIGAPGFGFAPDSAGRLHDIAQLGGVVIGADVSVGATSTIDCGAIEDTVIEDGVKIDNQVQIGHNCRVGAHTVLCGCVGLAGSSTVGRHCVFAGGAGVGGSGPVSVCDGVTVTARTIITQSVTTPGVYSGTIVFHDHNKWRRNVLRFESLDDLFKRVRRLETRFKTGSGASD